MGFEEGNLNYLCSLVPALKPAGAPFLFLGTCREDLAANMKDRQARLAANRAALAANKLRRVGLDRRVVFGVLAIASWPWLA
jgi:hypothetical protein